MRLRPGMNVVDLVDVYRRAGAFNGGRLAEGCDLFARMIDSGATIALTVTGAMAPAGLGGAIQAMIEAGFVDLVIATGANLYHDLHFALKLPVVQGHFAVDDRELYRAGIERIYDVFITEDSLLDTDAFVREALEKAPRRSADGSPRLGSTTTSASWCARTPRFRRRAGWRPPRSTTCRSSPRRPATPPSA